MAVNIFRSRGLLLKIGLALVALLASLCWSRTYVYDNRRPSFAFVRDSLGDKQIAAIDSLYNRARLQSFTNPLLVVRYVNSPGHETVRSYLTNFLRTRQYVVEEDVFVGSMPNGTRFTGANIVASSSSITPTTRRLILSCHWDSKYVAQYPFIGATDSAVPCGMLLWIADAFKSVFTDPTNKELLRRANVALQFVFFDGEEAIEEWTDTDSIYGSRHLAEKWQNENKIASIDLLVLLDLLGAANPRFYSFFMDTEPFFKSLGESEGRLQRLWSRLGAQQVARTTIFGTTTPAPGHISDDHLPFLRRNVPVLHLIPYPFPNVWHTERDNAASIDWPTVDRLTRIFAIFTIRQMNGLILANSPNSDNTLMVPDASSSG